LTLVELLVATLLLGVALGGLIAIWPFGYNVTRRSQDVAIGYNIARQEVERAKNVGFMLLPEATWTTGYDGLGQPTSDESPHFTAVTTLQTIPDVNGELNTRCLRLLEVRVTERDVNGVVFETETYLTRGGV
jgi:type II secretory pathway pseudopilin PulG